MEPNSQFKYYLVNVKIKADQETNFRNMCYKNSFQVLNYKYDKYDKYDKK